MDDAQVKVVTRQYGRHSMREAMIIIALMVLVATGGEPHSLLFTFLQLIVLSCLGWRGFVAGFVVIAVGAIADKFGWYRLSYFAVRVGEHMIVCGPVAAGILWVYCGRILP